MRRAHSRGRGINRYPRFAPSLPSRSVTPIAMNREDLTTTKAEQTLPSPSSSDPRVDKGIASGVSDLISAINKVELLLDGVKDALPLPRIVAVGDQSSGKSSLIEAISEIHVPRDSGTCTRCPIQINLLECADDQVAQWSCKLSYISKYSYGSAGAHDPSEHRLYPWVQNPDPKKYDFATTTDKTDIEKMIRVAQLVVLNPSLKNPEQWFLKWLNDDPQDLHGFLDFSPNVIVLNITAPGLLPISFYDLPGVINQAPDGNPHTVTLIRQLVKDYVEQEHTLVLLAVSMESDIEVSTTSGLLNSTDGANDRCMGVLTKPDRRPRDGDTSKYRGVLENKMFKKGHGYFVTRQPAQSEIHALDYTGARDIEDKFFQSSEWMRDFPNFEDQVGTRNIRSALSHKLRALILQCLPKVMDMITQKLGEIEKELKGLPEPSQDPVRIVSELAVRFKECLIDKFGDKFKVNQLRQGWIADKKQFRESVLALKPTVSVLSKSEFRSYAVRQGSVEDDDDCSIIEEPTPKKAKTESQPNTELASKICFELDQIQKDLQDRTISSIPGMINPKAVEDLMVKTLQHWKYPLNNLWASLHRRLIIAHDSAREEVLGDFSRTSVPEKIREIVRNFLDSLMGRQKSMDTQALHLELFKPITENEQGLSEQKDAELSSLVAERKKQRVQKSIEIAEHAGGKKLSSEERRKVQDKMGPDPYLGELEVIARVKAYYQIAAYRFIDRICQNVEYGLLNKLKTGLKEELENELHIIAKDAFEYCTALLEIDPAHARLRATLIRDQGRLMEARERLSIICIEEDAKEDTMQE